MRGDGDCIVMSRPERRQNGYSGNQGRHNERADKLTTGYPVNLGRLKAGRGIFVFVTFNTFHFCQSLQTIGSC
jgi:hypothetical protein